MLSPLHKPVPQVPVHSPGNIQFLRNSPELIAWKTQKPNYGHKLVTDTIRYPPMVLDNILPNSTLLGAVRKHLYVLLSFLQRAFDFYGSTRESASSKILIINSNFGKSTLCVTQSCTDWTESIHHRWLQKNICGGETKCFQLSAAPDECAARLGPHLIDTFLNAAVTSW